MRLSKDVQLWCVRAWVAIIGISMWADPAWAEAWPQYRRDSSRSAVTGERLEGRLTPKWVHRAARPPHTAWPGPARADKYSKIENLSHRQLFDIVFQTVAAQGRVLFGSSSEDKLVCLDAATGKVLWTHFAEGPIRFAPVIEGQRVYVGSDDGCVYALNLADGQEVWTRRLVDRQYRVAGNERVVSAWPVRGGLTIHDGTLYTAAGTFPVMGVYAMALNAKDGAVIWSTQIQEVTAQGYVLASPTRVYVPTGRNNPIVFDRQSGKSLRIIEGGGGTWALLSGDQLFFGPQKTGQLGVVDPNRADQITTFAGNHMVVHDRMSYVQNDSRISAIDRVTFLDLARRQNQARRDRAAAAEALKKLGGNLPPSKAGPLKERIAAIDKQINEFTKNMADCYKWHADSRDSFEMILAGDLIITGGENRVSAFHVADGHAAWSLPVDGRAYGLMVCDGRLVVSTDKGVIHCFEVTR